MLVVVTAANHKERKAREFDIEFVSAVSPSNPDALLTLVNTLQRAFNESSLEIHPGMYIHPLKKRYHFRVKIFCYDVDAPTRALRDLMSGIRAVRVEDNGIRRGKVIWPAIGPRADKPASEHAERQRRHRNKHIYNIG